MTAHTKQGHFDTPKRFAKTYCSQCGSEFGPGNCGYSHCEDHQTGPIEVDPIASAALDRHLANARMRIHAVASTVTYGRRAKADAARRESVARTHPGTTIRTAFSDLLVALSDNAPVNIIGEADAIDMEERADHVHDILSAVETYLNAVLADAKNRTSGLDFDVNVLGILNDTRGDIVGTFTIAAEKMREAEQSRGFDIDFE